MQDLSRRERQVMEVLFRLGRPAPAGEVMDELPDPPSYSAVRSVLRILVEKGAVRRQLSGKSYLYTPRGSRGTAERSAIKELVQTFFDGSAGRAVNALLDLKAKDLSDEELEALSRRIEEARREGR